MVVLSGGSVVYNVVGIEARRNLNVFHVSQFNQVVTLSYAIHVTNQNFRQNLVHFLKTEYEKAD